MYNPKLHFHFSGIGGVGMSGLAEVLLHQGFRVSGSDLVMNDACRRLERLGAKISLGHRAENLPLEASLLVYSSAVKQDNSEILAAKEREIPVIPRAQVLAELMRLKFGIAVAGSHGKTTTTSFIAHILEYASKDPTVVIGGQVKSIGGSGAKLGRGEFLVAESDESDRSFLLLKPTIAVVTNIDSEHMEAYSSMAELEHSFQNFVESIPFYGLAVLGTDDHRVEKIAKSIKQRKVTFGLSDNSEYYAKNIQHLEDGMRYSLYRNGQSLGSVRIPMLGTHMVSNSLAAVAVAHEVGIETDKIIQAFSSFPGVGRRLEKIGESHGISVLSDYGHHPTEIKATLAALKASIFDTNRKLHVVFQPHRYSRTKACFVDFLGSFVDSDFLYLTEIYSANEMPLDGVTGEALFNAVPHPCKTFVSDLKDTQEIVSNLKGGDIVLCLGAGSIGQLPKALLDNISSAGKR